MMANEVSLSPFHLKLLIFDALSLHPYAKLAESLEGRHAGQKALTRSAIKRFDSRGSFCTTPPQTRIDHKGFITERKPGRLMDRRTTHDAG